MMDPLSGLFNVLFDGSQGYPDSNTFIAAQGIQTGQAYTFKVVGAYINGYT